MQSPTSPIAARLPAVVLLVATRFPTAGTLDLHPAHFVVYHSDTLVIWFHHIQPDFSPFIVTAHVRDNVYQVQSLVDFAYQEIHLDRLRLYAPDVNCDSSLVASWDSEEFQIDHISQHTGTPRKRTAMTFLVRWLNYGEESDSWEPYAHLKHTTAFDTYAKLHNLSF